MVELHANNCSNTLCLCVPDESLAGYSLPESAGLAQFNKSWAELIDWLTMLDNMVQNKRVVVADLDNINNNIDQLKVTTSQQDFSYANSLQSTLAARVQEVSHVRCVFLGVSAGARPEAPHPGETGDGSPEPEEQNQQPGDPQRHH